MDECSGDHICHAFANCLNEPGGYSCRCAQGFRGNGHTCEPVQEEPTTEPPAPSSTTPNIPSLAPEHWLCDQCAENANCYQGVCECREGWQGDGFRCVAKCTDGYVWDSEQCVPGTEGDECKCSFYKAKIFICISLPSKYFNSFRGQR